MALGRPYPLRAQKLLRTSVDSGRTGRMASGLQNRIRPSQLVPACPSKSKLSRFVARLSTSLYPRLPARLRQSGGNSGGNFSWRHIAGELSINVTTAIRIATLGL